MKIQNFVIDKNSRESLPDQLVRILRQRIKCGYYVPGKKIDSVRMIAKAFGVSTVSVQTALSLLKEDGTLESIPGSGLFVRKDFLKEQQSVNIAFVFPEAMISPNNLSSEDWITNSEIHLGLLRGAEIYGAKVNFIYLDENMPEKLLNQRLAEIRQNNAVLFVGRQLNQYRDMLAKEMFVFNIISEHDRTPDDVIQISPDNRGAIATAVEYAVKSGCRSAGIITYLDKRTPEHHALQTQSELFVKLCKEAGLNTPERYDWKFDDQANIGSALKEKLEKDRPDFLLCNYSYLVSDLYEICRDAGLKIGKDIKIMAKSPGLIFQGMIPSLTYLKPPAFENAVDIVNYACRLTRGTISVAELNLHKNKYQLIVGKSTGEVQVEKNM